MTNNSQSLADKWAIKNKMIAGYRNEHGLHVFVASWLVKHLPRFIDGGKNVWFHIPNGGDRDIITAGQMKAIGTTRGIPDLCFIKNSIAYFIELKYDNGRLTKEQKLFSENENIYYFAECRSLQEVIDRLMKWGVYNDIL